MSGRRQEGFVMGFRDRTFRPCIIAVTSKMGRRRSPGGRTLPTVVQSPGRLAEPRATPQPREKEVVGAGFGPQRRLLDEGEIGAGGWGSVHRAYDPNLRRIVAVKVMADR